VQQREFDVIVLGLGPGGEHVAGELARAGLSVAGVEDRLVGGECPYWGCVPSKMMIRAANLLAEGRRIPGLAGASVISPNWSAVASRVRDEATDDWHDTVAAARFTDLGGTLVRGRGTITGPGQVRAGGELLRARRGIVINTGTAPAAPPVPGLAGTPFWTNREIIETERVPHSLVVLGGGAVGAELSQVFARFGSVVTIIQPYPRLLVHEEPESGELLATVFAREGIDVRTDARAESVSYGDRKFTVSLSRGEQVTADQLLVATERRTDLPGLGVAAIGLDDQAGFIETDDRMLAAPDVWAIGDVTGHGAYTHMSMYQAEIVISGILGRPHHRAEYHAVPRITFTDPEVGAVGLTEAQARERSGSIATAVTPLAESARGWIHKAGNDGFIKLVADTERGVLVGATSAGPDGGEVLSMLTLAVHAEIPVARLSEMIYAYPAFHRAVLDTIGKLP
jgi:pyruvate/2-oxoglutarate dehydrogenase complex dihydrolipoamide dehydrogenase (E3) component